MKTNRRDSKRAFGFQSLEHRLALAADGVNCVTGTDSIELAELSNMEVANLEYATSEISRLELVSLEPIEIELKAFDASSVDLTAEPVPFDVKMTEIEFRGLGSNLPLDAEITTAERGMEDLDAYMLLGGDDNQSEVTLDSEFLESDMFRTFTSGLSLTVMDVSSDGLVDELDVELIIGSLNMPAEDASALESQAVEVSLDINRDGLVSALDALIVINWINHLPASDEPAEPAALIAVDQSNEDGRHALIDNETVGDVAKVDMDAVLESFAEAAQELHLADVGTFGVISLKVDSEGNLTAVADSLTVEPLVGEDGSIAIGDLTLPARVVKTESGTIGLLSGYVVETSNYDLAGDDGLMQTRMAGATHMTVTGAGQLGPIVLSFNDQGEILAVENGRTLKVATDEQDRLSIDGIAIPVAVVSLADTRVFVPSDRDAESFITVAWPASVDEAFDSWE